MLTTYTMRPSEMTAVFIIIAVYAMERDMSLNQFVERSIEKGLSAGVL